MRKTPTMLKSTLPLLTEEHTEQKEGSKELETIKKNWKNVWFYFGDTELKWFNIFLLGWAHLFSIYSIYYILVTKKLYFLFVFYYVPIGYIGAFGVTAGAHRLYSHRCYKAKLPVRVFLILAYASSGMNSLYNWARDHRVHHKFTDTNSDPHNASRGFFYSHVGWLLMKKNSEVIKEGRKMDMSDILQDPVVQFEEKYFLFLTLSLCHVIPMLIPWYFWNYELWDCFGLNVLKWVISLNLIWSINSAAHLWGTKPFDKKILPSDNGLLSIFSIGEGWHNYHHTFPWDYKAAELAWWLNLTGFILDIWASMGLIYDLKSPSKELIENVAKNRGDGSREVWRREVPETDEKIKKRRFALKQFSTIF